MRFLKANILYLLICLPICSFAQSNKLFDTCRTYLYYQQIGDSYNTNYLSVSKARTVQDDGIVSVGGNGNDAMVMKQNRDGKIIWQKLIGTPAGVESFGSFRELRNKDLLIGGTYADNVTPASLLFVKTSSDGNLIWEKSFSLPDNKHVNNVKVFPVVSIPYNEVFFAAQGESSIIYGVIDTSGNMLWQKAITTDTNTELIDVTAQAGNLLIAANSIDSGYHVAKFYYIPYYSYGQQSIKSTRKVGGASENANYILHDMEFYSQYSYFSGIRSVNNQPYELIRININQGYLGEALESFTTPGVLIDKTARSAISLYGECIAFTPTLKNKDVYLLKTTGSYNYTTNFYWSEKTTWQDDIMLIGCIKTWDNGYNIFGYKTNAISYKVSQLKIDSAGTTPACINREEMNFSVKRNPFPTSIVTYTYLTDASDAIFPSGFTPFESNMIIDTVVFCKELKCPKVPKNDICLNSFYKIYQGYNQTNLPSSILTIDNDVFICGKEQAMDYKINQINTFIAKLNTDGEMIKQRIFFVGNEGCTGQLRQTNDNSLMMFGYTSAAEGFLYAAKIDRDLNVLWVRTFPKVKDNSTSYEIGDITQSSDGSFYALVSEINIFNYQRLYLIKLDANGNFIWSKIYKTTDPTSPNNNIRGYKIVTNGGHVYIISVNAYNSYGALFLLKIDETGGNTIWYKRYTNTDQNLRLINFANIYNNELFLSGRVGVGSLDKNILVKFDLDGNVKATKSIQTIGTISSPVLNIFQQSNGDLCIASRYKTNTSFDFNLKLNSNFDIIRAKQRATYFLKDIYATSVANDGYMYESGTVTTTFFDLYTNYFPYLIKYDLNGNVGICPSDTLILQDTSVAIYVTTIPCVPKDTVFILKVPPITTEQHYLAKGWQVCASVQGCNQLKLTGRDAICRVDSIYTYQANKNNGCQATVQWEFDQQKIKLIYANDNFIQLKFSQNGDYKLKATLLSNCVPFSDSITIHVAGINTPTLDLGADTILCNNASLNLNAHKGFKTYLWQNGSTDSTLTINTSGKYSVTVTDYCDNILKDSINVYVYSVTPLLSIGRDTTLCAGSSLLLNAHKGFKTYIWQDGFSDSLYNVTSQGLYHVTVTDSCNNILKDSVLIRFYRAAGSLNIGRDTILCNGSSVLLNAHAGFKKYLWQDSSTDSLYTASSPGKYFITVTDSCNNVFTDTLFILTDNNNQFDIGPDIIKCNTDTVNLNINTGFSNYVWGPDVKMIKVSPTVVKVYPDNSIRYYVSAQKSNGCTLYDSVFITVNHSPLINIGNDVKLCPGDSIPLYAGPGFQQYTWSSGQQTPDIYTHAQGLYTISATDINHCVSKDSVTISFYSTPLVQLTDDTTICLGQNKILTAGQGFSSYLWSTGSQAENITVSTLDKYWVTATNASGCQSSDTAYLKSYKAPIINFLKTSDNVVCQYDPISIHIDNLYAAYEWNTGSNASSIQINTPGLYWLRVTDNEGCISIDSVLIGQKDCTSAIYFANSFTPNSDGINDVYRPTIFGPAPEIFLLKIYNRYGELVFETNDVSKGWNGLYKGVLQNSSAFVYYCNYKLRNEKAAFKKGTILLIR